MHPRLEDIRGPEPLLPDSIIQSSCNLPHFLPELEHPSHPPLLLHACDFGTFSEAVYTPYFSPLPHPCLRALQIHYYQPLLQIRKLISVLKSRQNQWHAVLPPGPTSAACDQYGQGRGKRTPISPPVQPPIFQLLNLSTVCKEDCVQ